MSGVCYEMKKVSGYSCRRALDRLCLFPAAAYHHYSSCLCNSRNKNSIINNNNNFEDKKPLIDISHHDKSDLPVKLKDVIDAPPTLAFQLKPKMVVLRVSMHCNGCARQVKKHISKLEGVTSYEIDFETKMVVITGDIVPFEVLESVSKVKNAELWNDE